MYWQLVSGFQTGGPGIAPQKITKKFNFGELDVLTGWKEASPELGCPSWRSKQKYSIFFNQNIELFKPERFLIFGRLDIFRAMLVATVATSFVFQWHGRLRSSILIFEKVSREFFLLTLLNLIFNVFYYSLYCFFLDHLGGSKCNYGKARSKTERNAGGRGKRTPVPGE